MIVRSTDVNGDWNFGKGRNDYKSRTDAVEQAIKTRLNSFLGDCFFATTSGIDWFNLIGSKNQLALELAIRSVILNTPEVSGLIDVSTTFESTSRLMTVVCKVSTIHSDTTILEVTTTTYLLTESGDVLTDEDGGGLLGG